MYWIPIIFIIFELIFIHVFDKIRRLEACNFLYNKFNDNNKYLESYIKNEFSGMENIKVFISLFFLFEFIYFFIGFFYPFIWIASTYIILTIFYKSIIPKKEVDIKKYIQIANLKIKSEDMKFSRLLKLNELKQEKTNFWNKLFYVGYIDSLIRIIIFISIIVLHYNFNLI